MKIIDIEEKKSNTKSIIKLSINFKNIPCIYCDKSNSLSHKLPKK